MKRKMVFWVMPGILFGLLGACGQEGFQKPGSAPSMGSEIRFKVPFSSHITGLTATLEISGVGTYSMAVNGDGTVSTTIPDIPAGWHTFTVTYTLDGIMLARVSTGDEVVAGQTITVVFLPQDLDRNFDEDGDGWVNLAEVLWGSDPLLATSFPPGEDPRFTLLTAGGQVQSASHTLQDSVGEALEGGRTTGGPYTIEGGFQAYPE